MTTLSKSQLDSMVEHEEEHWTAIFAEEKQKLRKSLFSSYWWQDYYSNITRYIESKCFNGPSNILELGAGSGKATLLLSNKHKKDLFDISETALDFAKDLNKKVQAPNVTYIVGNAFDHTLNKGNYDLVWNIGVLEHYESDMAQEFCDQMVELVKPGGYVAIAIPNFNSLPAVKARLLNYRLLSWIPGYKADTELDYSVEDVKAMLLESAVKQHRIASKIDLQYFGNPLIMETPKFILKTFGALLNRMLPRARFLHMVVIKLDMEELSE